MLWRGQRQSSNIEDLRGLGGIGGKGLALGGGGCGTLIIVILGLLFGFDPSSLLNQDQAPQQPNPATQTRSQQRSANQTEDEAKAFISTVLASTEDVWRTILPQQTGRQYREPTLVLFTGQVRSACGRASAAVGPFYCPADEKIYIDLAFYRELRSRFQAPGDFAQAYVLAHEVGHHVQNILGTSSRVDAMQRRAGERQANELSVRLELQADYYAGVWARYVQQKGLLESGDVEEALRAASAVGDDSIQKQTQGYVVPDSFTHGSSAQRMQWFRAGLESGDVRGGNALFSSSGSF